jgi:hypothetical protein
MRCLSGIVYALTLAGTPRFSTLSQLSRNYVPECTQGIFRQNRVGLTELIAEGYVLILPTLLAVFVNISHGLLLVQSSLTSPQCQSQMYACVCESEIVLQRQKCHV